MPVRRSQRLRKRIGRVSLYLHHGAWWLYYRDGTQAIRRRVSTDRGEAERIAAEVNAQVAAAAPTMFAFSPTNMVELRQRFLNYHEDVLKSSVATINRYRTATQHLIDYAAGLGPKIKVHEIPIAEFVAFLRKRQVSPNGHRNTAKRLLRDKGVQFVLEVSRSMYTFAQRQRHLPPYATNPFSDLRLDRMRLEDRKPVFIFDEATELQFLRSCKEWEFPVHFTLAKSGMRPGELCHLMIEDIDLQGGWIHVRNKADLGWSVKTRNERDIPLIEEMVEVLHMVVGQRRSGLLFRRPKFVASSNDFQAPDLRTLKVIFDRRKAAAGSDSGNQLNRQQIAKLAWSVWRDAGAFDADQIRMSFIRVAKRAALGHLTCPKSWRHTFATLMQDANVDPLIRQITMGHQPSGANSALGMTAVYSHSRPETRAREIERALRTWPQTLTLAREWAKGRAQ